MAAGPGSRNPPLIQVFGPSGKLLKEIDRALPNAGYGAWVAVGCGRIYAAPGPGPGNPRVILELSPDGRILSRRELDHGLENGIRATVAGPQNCSRLLAWGSPVSVNESRVFLCDMKGNTLDWFDTFPTTFGINLTTLRLGSGQPGLAVTPGPLEGYPPLVLMLDLRGRRAGAILCVS